MAKCMFRATRRSLYTLFLLGLIAFGSSPSAYGINNCKDIFRGALQVAVQSDHSTLSAQAKQTQLLLDRKIPLKLREALGRRWRQLDEQLFNQGWENFYSNDRPLPLNRVEAFNEIQVKRMSPSTTISGKNSNDPNAAVAERNWKLADRKVYEWVRGHEPLTIERMFELNEIIGKDLYFNGSKPGARRTGDVGVPYSADNVRKFQSALKATNIDPMLAIFVDWYNRNEGSLHPIELAAQVYQRLNTIHPFPDGNGRTTRLVTDWILRRNGFPPCVFMNIESTYVVIFPDDQLGRNPAPGFVEETVTEGLEWVADIWTRNKTQSADALSP